MSVRVLDYVRRTPISVKPMVSIREAVKIMYENSIGSIVIVDDQGKPMGIFTERDLLRVIAQGTPLETPVADVMSRNLVTIKGDDSIVKAAILMSEHRIRHLPVIDEDGRLVGVISIRDVVEALRGMLAVRAAEGELSMFTA